MKQTRLTVSRSGGGCPVHDRVYEDREIEGGLDVMLTVPSMGYYVLRIDRRGGEEQEAGPPPPPTREQSEERNRRRRDALRDYMANYPYQLDAAGLREQLWEDLIAMARASGRETTEGAG